MFPLPVNDVLTAFRLGDDRVRLWGGQPSVNIADGEVEAEFHAILREDDPRESIHPRFRVKVIVDLGMAYDIARMPLQDDCQPDDGMLALFDLELLLPPVRSLWPRERLLQLASEVSDQTPHPSCTVDYANDELPYRHTLAFEHVMDKADFLDELGGPEEDEEEGEEERPRPFYYLFDLMTDVLVAAKRWI